MTVQHWETYYRGGALATCPTAPDGGYDRELSQAWETFFGALPSATRMLDIGTGNGAIPALAVAYTRSRGLNWEIHGSDLARIEPMRNVAEASRRLAGVQFHPQVATEDLPFAEASLDAVTGQYALEYCDLPRALAEIARVLTPGGHAQFVMHHTNSRLLQNARASLEQASLVRESTGLYGLLRVLISATDPTAPATEHAANGLRQALRQLKTALPAAIASNGGQMLSVSLDAAQQLLRARASAGPEAVLPLLERAEAELDDGVKRLLDLQSHSMDETSLEAAREIAASVGLDTMESGAQLHAANTLVGWRWVLRRR